jgi:peptide deformylase
MAILKVASLGHPMLRAATQPLSMDPVGSSELHRLIEDMIETMREYSGVGLAANQVHVSRQIAVLEVADNPRYPEKGAVPLTLLINPRIDPLSEATEEDWEGCLSVPNLRGKVPRFKKIRVRALGLDGAEIDFTASDFHARVIQHEWDHLNGKVYLDRMRDLSTLTHLQEYARFWAEK